MTDIRKLLQEAEWPSLVTDRGIAAALRNLNNEIEYSFDYIFAIEHIEDKGYDWIMGNVNGQVGGTPYACVGVPQDKASYAATPLLSLWLSYFRLELGDERDDNR